MLNVTKYLPHIGVVSHFATNQFGDTALTSSYTTPCFYYYGPRTRYRNGPIIEESLNHFLLLPSTAVVAQDYAVSPIVDSNGDTVAPAAKIKRVERFTHWRDGVVLIQVILEVN